MGNSPRFESRQPEAAMTLHTAPAGGHREPFRTVHRRRYRGHAPANFSERRFTGGVYSRKTRIRDRTKKNPRGTCRGESGMVEEI